MCIVLYRSAMRCAKFGVAIFKVSLFKFGVQSAMGIYELFYTYRSAKFGVVVFKASMLDWLGGQSAIGICAFFYIYIDLPSLV